MKTSNAAFDQADELAENERQSGIKAASKALSKAGTLDCIVCGEPIGRVRKAVLPSATRCVTCQETYEKERAGR